MAETAAAWQGFLIWPDRVQEVDPDGEWTRSWKSTDLYNALVLAGYPVSRDDTIRRFDAVIDLSVDPTDPQDVTVYTTGPGAHEQPMGAAAEVFLDWYRRETLDG